MSRFSLQCIIILLFSAISSGSSLAQKVFMTGDSHVYGKIYPKKVEEILRTQHPEIDFSFWAKNGICFYSFNSNPEFYDSIFAFHPDILIVHLGTNGAYDTNFNSKSFRTEMEYFHNTLVKHLPDVKMVFVTPFTNKRRKYKKKGKWYVNNKNRLASDVIVDFVAEHPGTFVIDNNKDAGMLFLKDRSLIRPDNVHLTAEGYNHLGKEIGEGVLEISELWD